ncbi:MAG: RluA family pseudouridine synthase [Planctomycetota bacterium]
MGSHEHEHEHGHEHELRRRVPHDLAGGRLDLVLVALTQGLSRTRLQNLIKSGLVQIDGEVTRQAKTTVEAGARLRVEFPPEAPAVGVEGEAIVSLSVIHEDEHILVVDKPAGLLVHSNRRSRGGSLADLAQREFGPLPAAQGEDRPGIVHRLDRLTSGVLVLGRTPQALAHLMRQFLERRVEKTYLALCHGAPRFDTEWIQAPIGSNPRHRERRRVVPEGEGRSAETYIERREDFSGVCLMLAQPKTGRTHQIRVHLFHVGLPVVGDRVYRHRGALRHPIPEEAPVMQRQALHAAVLEFDHPVSGERLRFEAPMPADMTALLEWLRRVRTVS